MPLHLKTYGMKISRCWFTNAACNYHDVPLSRASLVSSAFFPSHRSPTLAGFWDGKHSALGARQ